MNTYARYAALLLMACLLGTGATPPAAIASAQRPSAALPNEIERGQSAIGTSQRTIQFAGQTWAVKAGCGMGPGPNCWSDSQESVWVDQAGALHLKIRQIEGTWHCAEVYSTHCTTYGTHRFFLEGRLDLLDPNVVAAPFLYQDDLHEIDIEFARWGQASAPDNAQYVVQPWSDAGHLERFAMTAHPSSTHTIDWQAAEVHFESIAGHATAPAAPSDLIYAWSYQGSDVPQAQDCLRVHINLWLYQGQAPTDGQAVEIAVIDVQTPLTPTAYLPLVLAGYPPPWIAVHAEGNTAWGEVGPAQYCNDRYKVALYAKTDLWYVQPRRDAADIPIAADCTWRSTILTWNQVAAHLVEAAFTPPDTIGPPAPPCPPLDPDGEAQVLAAGCTP